MVCAKAKKVRMRGESVGATVRRVFFLVEVVTRLRELCIDDAAVGAVIVACLTSILVLPSLDERAGECLRLT